MYCSSCGTGLKPDLSYCNRCGAEQGAKGGAAKMSETLPESLVWALVCVTVGGLAMLIGLMAVMKDVLNFGTELIVAFTLLSFLMLVAADSVLIWMILRSKGGLKQTGGKAQMKGLATNDLGQSPPRELPEPALSVTEHTTRTLDRAETDRK